ncbi:division/cell wall cluster transcriptional repressor MraZ [Thermosulfurimonas dismutans]|uniref:Transcriptional regulator MraZ n=1 Tax=Thermosulfurimonas dismutans TaxID=999894 RepID=A0A179D255_9BACT|nr:division/cell wall cluster transcriptional repressor MraZ [Thermosulfurimonas dismutans]OAQ20130.1 Cell division protein MraZ [Thermosulfurimonas dismutans]
MFRGQFRHNLDEKGRLSIPRRFREVLRERYGGSGLVVTRLPECLVAYPWEEWRRLEERLMGLPADLPEVRLYMRYFLGSAEECFPDRQGRILLPAHLREAAGIEREAVLLGLLDRFEIWNPERLSIQMEAAREGFDDLSRKVAELSLGGSQA